MPYAENFARMACESTALPMRACKVSACGLREVLPQATCSKFPAGGLRSPPCPKASTSQPLLGHSCASPEPFPSFPRFPRPFWCLLASPSPHPRISRGALVGISFSGLCQTSPGFLLPSKPHQMPGIAPIVAHRQPWAINKFCGRTGAATGIRRSCPLQQGV